MAPYTNLSLFTGAGGGELATQHLLGWQTVCYVEWDEYAIEILKARIRDGYLHDAPIWDNVFTFDGQPWRGIVDVVSAGFPCQPFSVAGKGLAENDPRNGWPATIRIIREVRPTIAWLENVPGLVSKPYFHTVLADLSEAGFDIQWGCLSAVAVGANHKRDRLWILAIHPERIGWTARTSEGIQSEKQGTVAKVTSDLCEKSNIMANANSGRSLHRKPEKYTTKGNEPTFRKPSASGDHAAPLPDTLRNGREGIGSDRHPERPAGLRRGEGGNEIENILHARGEWWAIEPELGRVANGVANRVDRLRATGNGQVPAVVRAAWKILAKREGIA